MQKENLNFIIYNYIKAHSRLPKHSASEKSKYAYHCRKLLEEGKIEKIGYGVWKVKEVQTSSNNKHIATAKIRSHGYRFNIRVPLLDLYHKKELLLHKFKIPYKKIPQGFIVKVRRHNVYLYKNTIQVTFRKGKSFSGSDPQRNNLNAIIEFKKTMARLERLLHTDFKIDNNYMFQCHHADINNAIADWHYSKGVRKFTVRDSNGEEWLLMDNSFNLLELETIHPVSSTKDMKEIVIPFMNKLKDDPLVITKMENTIIKQSEVIDALQQQLQAQALMTTKLTENVNTLVNYIKSRDNM